MALVDTAAIGKLGGEARARNLTAKQMSDIGRKGAEARWGKTSKATARIAAKRKAARPAAKRKKAGK